MDKIDWSKFLAREFLVSLGLMIFGSYEMHRILEAGNFSIVFPIWAGAMLGFLAVWVTGLTKQKIAAVKANIVARIGGEDVGQAVPPQ